MSDNLELLQYKLSEAEKKILFLVNEIEEEFPRVEIKDISFILIESPVICSPHAKVSVKINTQIK